LSFAAKLRKTTDGCEVGVGTKNGPGVTGATEAKRERVDFGTLAHWPINLNDLDHARRLIVEWLTA
jgi:hypothetical protein